MSDEKKEHSLAEAIRRSSPVYVARLDREGNARLDARDARRTAARNELLQSARFAELASVARFGGAALNLACQHNPTVRAQHAELTAELDALDDPGPEAA